MYAVVETGGKQYRVELGSELVVERLTGDPGDTINLDRVLLVADGDAAQIGTPTVGDALVTASLVRHDRGDKVIVFKYRPKARHRAKKGHRQEQTVIRIADIQFKGRSAAKEAGEQEKQESKSRKAAAEAAASKAAADQALAAKLAEQESADAEKATKTAATEAKKSTGSARSAVKPKPSATAPKPAKSASAAAKPTKSTRSTSPASKSTSAKSTSAKSTPAKRATKKKDE